MEMEVWSLLDAAKHLHTFPLILCGIPFPFTNSIIPLSSIIHG